MKNSKKKLLFICDRNIVLGPIASALFQHIGASLLLRWDVFAFGLLDQSGLKNYDKGKVAELLKKYAVPFKEHQPQLVSPEIIKQADLIICFNSNQVDCIQEIHPASDCKPLGKFFPDGCIDIPDPVRCSETKAYETCYWSIYKSMRNLVKFLKEDEDNVLKKKRRVKLPDPTIFTITSPSAWQKNQLKCPCVDIVINIPDFSSEDEYCSCEVLSLSPPQDILEEDNINYPSDCKDKLISDGDEIDDIEFNAPICILTIERVGLEMNRLKEPILDQVEDTINHHNCGQLNKSLNHIHLVPPTLIVDFPIFSDDFTDENKILRLNAPQLVEPIEPISDTINISYHPVKVFQNEDEWRVSLCGMQTQNNTSLELSGVYPSLRNILKISAPQFVEFEIVNVVAPTKSLRTRGDLFDQVRQYRAFMES